MNVGEMLMKLPLRTRGHCHYRPPPYPWRRVCDATIISLGGASNEEFEPLVCGHGALKGELRNSSMGDGVGQGWEEGSTQIKCEFGERG